MKIDPERETREFFNKRIKIKGDNNFSSIIEEKNNSGHMILDFLKSKIDLKKKILDAGCGEGRFSRYFINKGVDITGMDFSEEYIRLAKKNIKKGKFVLGSVTSLPFENNSFDYIFTVDVLQHVPNTTKAIREFYRVLKKGGTLIIIDKNKFGLHPRYFIPEIIIKKYKELTEWRYSGFKERWFNPKKFQKELNKAFKNVRFEYLIEKNKCELFKIFPKLNFFAAWIAKK